MTAMPMPVGSKLVWEDGQYCLPTRPAALIPAAAGNLQTATITAATALAPPAGATVAVVSIEGQTARYRDDGTAPTTSSGVLLTAGLYQFDNVDLTKLQFISTVAGGTMNVLFYHY